MDVFDSYPAVLCAYTVGIYKKILHDYLRTILVSEPENEIEENQSEDVEMEKENKLQLLFYKNFKSFLRVLKDYYFLCMVKNICKTMMNDDNI